MKIIKTVTCPECGEDFNAPKAHEITVREVTVYKDTVLVTFKLPHTCYAGKPKPIFEGLSDDKNAATSKEIFGL